MVCVEMEDEILADGKGSEIREKSQNFSKHRVNFRCCCPSIHPLMAPSWRSYRGIAQDGGVWAVASSRLSDRCSRERTRLFLESSGV